MRVHLVLGTSTGGVGQHVRSLVDRLPGLGWDVTVVGPPATDDRFGFGAGGAAFTPLDIATAPRPAADLGAVRGLRILLRGADVVHAHGFRAAAFAGLALGRRRPGRTPLVATWHNAVLGSGARRRVLAGLERLAARRADVTLGASNDLVARAPALGTPDARPGPGAAAPLPPPRRSRAEVRAELGAGDRPLVLAVGRLAPQKDYGTLLDAARRWRTREPAPLVLVAGEGPLQADLQRRIGTERLPVRLLGRRSDVTDLLAAADVYVLTSHWEARALVLQEAARAGLPVVATAVGGVPELMGDTAVLVRPGDPAAVAGAVDRLLADEPLRTRLAAAASVRARGWPDEDDTARQVAAVYAGLAG
ncbi:MAG TPA: glycosyltransferase family 4 protein [Jiangellales bacterium]|nr:glycosyltransferase family 4 protein [Jiangellales bacterium]